MFKYFHLFMNIFHKQVEVLTLGVVQCTYYNYEVSHRSFWNNRIH